MLSKMATQLRHVVLGWRFPLQRIVFADHRQIAEHTVDLLHPFLGLQYMCANSLGNLLQEEILEQLALFFVQQRFLHLDTIAQDLKQSDGHASVLVEEYDMSLIVQVRPVFEQGWLFMSKRTYKTVIGVSILTLKLVFACWNIAFTQFSAEQFLSRSHIIASNSLLTRFHQLLDRIRCQQFGKVRLPVVALSLCYLEIGLGLRQVVLYVMYTLIQASIVYSGGIQFCKECLVAFPQCLQTLAQLFGVR